MEKADLYRLDGSALNWRRSTHTRDLVTCVEVADLVGGAVALRDSNNPARPDLRFTASEWAAFVAGVRDGEF